MTHTSTKQPEALRLAHALNGGKLIDDSMEWADTLHAASTELHRQHARIAELEDVADMAIKRIAELESQLSAIGAEPLRKQAVPETLVVPDGYALMPIEPTAGICKAAADGWLDCGSKMVLNKAGAAYRSSVAYFMKKGTQS